MVVFRQNISLSNLYFQLITFKKAGWTHYRIDTEMIDSDVETALSSVSIMRSDKLENLQC